MPLQHLDQRRLCLGTALGLLRDGLAGERQLGRGGIQSGGLQRGEQLARSERRRQGGTGQTQAERALDAGQQLDPGQTVEAQIAVEHAVERGAHRHAGLNFLDQLIDQRQQPGGLGRLSRTLGARHVCSVRSVRPLGKQAVGRSERAATGQERCFGAWRVEAGQPEHFADSPGLACQ
ncbi:hypothetical protein D3C78_1269030 [compost metagenome]